MLYSHINSQYKETTFFMTMKFIELIHSFFSLSPSPLQFHVLLHLEFPLTTDQEDCFLPVLSLTQATKGNSSSIPVA